MVQACSVDSIGDRGDAIGEFPQDDGLVGDSHSEPADLGQSLEGGEAPRASSVRREPGAGEGTPPRAIREARRGIDQRGIEGHDVGGEDAFGNEAHAPRWA
jgi:hypothetical protein